MDTAKIDVALFPIPNSVNFPGVPCPLHVFEPRYRQMVSYCIENEVLMGVCHTEKTVHANNREQTVEEALNSNQSTYKPQSVFSAGPVSLLQELEDGRLLIQVETSVRLQLSEEKQTLPFSIWACEELPDEPIDETEEAALAQTQEKILQRLIVVTHDNEQAQELLKGEYWQDMPAREFSFAIAGLLHMGTDLAQAFLEMTNPQERLDLVLSLINQVSPEANN